MDGNDKGHETYTDTHSSVNFLKDSALFEYCALRLSPCGRYKLLSEQLSSVFAFIAARSLGVSSGEDGVGGVAGVATFRRR